MICLNDGGGSGDIEGMTRSRISRQVRLAFALIVSAAPPAVAAAPADRVVVVVDSAAASGLDGDAVRRAISAELRASVVAPSDPAAAGVANVLIVNVDKATIRMTLRSDSGGTTTRSIAASLDRSARMRDIGWLAGNLLRDQVSAIVESAPRESRVAPATEPPPPTAPEKQPPATALAPSAGRGRATVAAPADAVAARASTPPVSPRPEWTVAALAGSSLALAADYERPFASTFQLVVQRRAAPRTLVVGGALHIGYAWTGVTVHLFGVDGFVGKEWRGARWFGEVTAGLGIEAERPYSGRPHSCPSSPCLVNPPDVSPILVAPLTSTVGVGVASRVDLAVRLIVQLSAGGLLDTSASATAGVRLRLP